MSWFDTAGFATLAKSALKEAQKTIDKALDIQDDDVSIKPKQSPVESVSSSSDVNTDSFFSAWGIQSSSSQSSPGAITKEVVASPGAKMTNSASLWGSFTGSFFDNQNKLGPEVKQTDLISDQPKKISSRSLSLDLSNAPTLHPTPSEPAKESPDTSEDDPDGEKIKEEILNFPQVEVVMRKREQKTAANRLSVISSESDRRSTDSCEVIGSTPDSDQVSISTSSSVAKLRQSGSFESVEVLTSPSSVDVLGSQSSTGGSPGDQKCSSSSISPVAEGEDVEVIPEDEDDVSIEDSNTSASENTLTMTVLEHSSNIMLKSTSSLETSFSEAMSPRESMNRSIVGMVLTHAVVPEGEKPRLEKKDKLQSQSSSLPQKEEVVTEAPKLSQSLSKVSECLSDPEGTQAETSSCDEGTIMGSSDEGANMRGATVSTMIAEAMTEPSNIIREQSPISSERSDLVKIGSSEHTSGDELETATSSDIEIISSPTPNGSSSTSRLSPSKSVFKAPTVQKAVPGKVKGHRREPSEASSGGSEESVSEVEKLHKRIAEMTELLEARESKLIDLSRVNAELHESNSCLKSQLEIRAEQQDVKSMNDEFTQRLLILERKFQQAIREKEAFRKQLEQAKAEMSAKEEDMEKDQLIAELRDEGEKLSKQQLVLNNTIKKLRTTEKENNKVTASLKDQLNSTTQELERIKKTMNAKAEMERSHIEAVHNLTKQVTQLQKELATEKANVATISTTLVSTQKELKNVNEQLAIAEKKFRAERHELENKIRGNLSVELEAAQVRIVSFQNALEDMRQQMIAEQEKHSEVEKSLRQELSEAAKRAELAKRRLEDESEAVKRASQPLARQLQILTETQATAQAQWEKQEALLNETINELETKLSNLTASERNARHLHETSSSRISELMDEVVGLREQNNTLLVELNASKENSEKVRMLKNSETKIFQQEKERLTAELDEKKREIMSLKEILSIERAALDAEKRKSNALQEQLRLARMSKDSGSQIPSPRSSPTLSFGRDSFGSETQAYGWSGAVEDIMETTSNSGRIYDVLRPSNNTSFLENLQAQLKLREGEVQQLQWEVARMDSERTALRDEITNLTERLQTQTEEVSSFQILKTQYDALLQMYGEKLEESQELKMDLQDMKEMYKAQIEELLKKDPEPGPPS